MARSNTRTRQDPAVLFYTSDFLSRTYGWTNEEVGAFVKLLCLQHQNGHLSKETMESICDGVYDKVISKFTQDQDGLFYNVELDIEKERRANYSKSRSNNANSGRKKKDNTDKPPKDNLTNDDSLPI